MMTEPLLSDEFQNQTQLEREELVANWLLSTPGFFERHPNLLLNIDLTSSFDGRVLSLQEKQMNVLRNQNRELNRKITEMLRFGVENDLTQSIMVKWLEDLCSKRSKQEVIENITSGLNDMFKVGRVEYVPPSEMNDVHLENLKNGIIVGSLPVEVEFASLKIDEQTGSFALIPLMIRDKQLGAVLLLSSDCAKYNLDTGLVYLEQLGRLAAAALSRFEDE